MKTATALAALALATATLTGCAAIPDAPITQTEAKPQGSSVALRESVWVGEVVATPIEVLEDSRCPENARCVWAGRLVVDTRIDGAGWRQTLPLTLGEPHTVRGHTVMLASGLPEKRADRETRQTEYRLTYSN